MKKEQTLLAVSVGVAGLLVWGSTGLYTPVGSGSLSAGTSNEATASVAADPMRGVRKDPPAGRDPVRQHRVEQRKEPPELPAPPAGSLPWIRPVPTPGLGPAFWSLLRQPMLPVARPAAAAAPDADAAAPEEEPEVAAARAAAEEKARRDAEDRRRVEAAAKIVLRDGTEKPCRITPLGEHEGQEVWRLLEKWPNVRFRVEELNPRDARTPIGSYDIGPDQTDRYITIHAEKTLENEFHEERTRRALKDTDRAAQMAFAAWVREKLAPRYGIPALRMAVGNLRTAWALGIDAPLALLIGEYCRDAFELEAEVRTYLEYLTGPRANDAQILAALGDAYERAGALHAARDVFARAADAGDMSSRVRSGALLLRLADRSGEFRAAHDEFARAQAAASPVDRAGALAGMAQARLAEGRVDEALALAKQAKQTDGTTWRVHTVLGSCQYVKGQFAEAESSFATAAAMESRGGTRARTNQAFALIAQDRVADAAVHCENALKSDPLNFVDPLVGLGEAHQRWGDPRGDDIFQTALQRHPSNAWVLLRLAAIRLRDGLPAAAMRTLTGGDGMPGLFQSAPESVDGLRIAGLASAALDPPKYDDAVRYLRRALQKEPRNADVVYDLARILHGAGRAEEALALLQAATNPQDGSARNDARVLALLAYVQFGAGGSIDAVYETLNRADKAIQDPAWTKAYVAQVREMIRTWDRTRIWEDTFDRSAQQKVGNGWDEDDSRLKVGIFLEGGNAVFKSDRAGALAAENRAGTSLKRVEDLDRIVEVEFALRADPGFEFVCHLWTGDLPVKSGDKRKPRGNEVGFGRDRNGRMTLWIYQTNDKMLDVPVQDAQGQPRTWPDDGAPHVVRIVRVDAAKGLFEIWLDGEKIATPEPVEVGALSAARGKKVNVGVHVDADPGSQVQLWLDRVKIEKTEGSR